LRGRRRRGGDGAPDGGASTIGDGDGAGDGDEADAGDGDGADASTGACTDDRAEDDDGFDAAQVPNYEDDMREEIEGAQVCAGDEDWFYVFLFEGETLQVTLTFDQASPAQDLDVVFWGGDCDLDGTNCRNVQLLTPCTERDPRGCDPRSGQSRDADEAFSLTAGERTAGHHWFVVRGFDGAENDYDLCTAISPETCP
jgi:hypothetical protein